MEEQIVFQKIDAPVVEGRKVVAVATVCVDDKLEGVIAFDAAKGVDVMAVGNAFIDFGAHLLEDNSAKGGKGGKGNGKA